MEDIWLTYDYTHFMNIDEETYEKYKNVDFTAKNINSVIELINKARKNEGIDISPLRELLEKTLNEDIIRKSNKDFGLVTVWWDKKINPHPLYIEDITNKNINIKTIVPSAYLGGSLNKDKDNVQKNINLGYLDAMKAYDRYEGIKYYFNVDYMFDEEYCFNKFKSLKIETIENILNLFNIKKDPTLRTLLEVLIPKLGENLGLDKDFSYKDLYEKKLEENNINRIQLYDFHKLYDVVNKNINENKNIPLTYETKSIIPMQKNKFTKVITNSIIKDFSNQF